MAPPFSLLISPVIWLLFQPLLSPLFLYCLNPPPMATRFDPSASLPSAPARGIALAGAVLIVLFLTILSASLLPARLLDAAWQLQVGGVLINASPFPLIGLVLLHLAASLDPRDPLLAQRRRLAARLAVAVALGYLLLAPLWPQPVCNANTARPWPAAASCAVPPSN